MGYRIIAHKWAHNMFAIEKKYQCPCDSYSKMVKGRKTVSFSCAEADFAPAVDFALKNNMAVENFYFPRNFRRSLQKTEMGKLHSGEKFVPGNVYLLLYEKERNKVELLYPELKKYIFKTNNKAIMIFPPKAD